MIAYYLSKFKFCNFFNSNIPATRPAKPKKKHKPQRMKKFITLLTTIIQNKVAPGILPVPVQPYLMLIPIRIK